MSNTSTVTPYVADNVGMSTGAQAAASGVGMIAGAAALCVVGAGVVAFTAGKWLLKQSSEEQAFHAEQRLRETRNSSLQDPVPAMNRAAIVSIPLAMNNPDSLLNTAQRIGCRLDYSDRLLRAEKTSLFPLVTQNGSRLLLEKTARGRLVIHAAGSGDVARQLVRQHTLDAALRHFNDRGMQIQTRVLAKGEVEIRTEESPVTRGAGGKAAITAKIHADGAVFMDVDRIKGNRCEQIVSDFAEAVGGTVVKVDKKAAYFQLPGEPVKINQHL